MLKKKGRPTRPFAHTDDCKIVRANPDVEIPWQEVETGHWQRVCQCGEEHCRELRQCGRRLDPLDPATARHLPECEFAHETDPAILKVLLEIKPGLGGGYDWIECGSCGAGWQVAHYAA
jgi:hypothetical protein